MSCNKEFNISEFKINEPSILERFDFVMCNIDIERNTYLSKKELYDAIKVLCKYEIVSNIILASDDIRNPDIGLSIVFRDFHTKVFFKK